MSWLRKLLGLESSDTQEYVQESVILPEEDEALHGVRLQQQKQAQQRQVEEAQRHEAAIDKVNKILVDINRETQSTLRLLAQHGYPEGQELDILVDEKPNPNAKQVREGGSSMIRTYKRVAAWKVGSYTFTSPGYSTNHGNVDPYDSSNNIYLLGDGQLWLEGARTAIGQGHWLYAIDGGYKDFDSRSLETAQGVLLRCLFELRKLQQKLEAM